MALVDETLRRLEFRVFKILKVGLMQLLWVEDRVGTFMGEDSLSEVLEQRIRDDWPSKRAV